MRWRNSTLVRNWQSCSIFRALGLPQDCPAVMTGVGEHALEDVGAALALDDLLDAVGGKLLAQSCLEVQFQHFPL